MKLLITNSWNLLAFSVFLSAQLAAQELRKIPTLPQLLREEAKREADLIHADLKNFFNTRKAELFSEDFNMKNFLLLQELCEDLKKISEGKEFQPLLLREISAQKAIDRPPVGWDEIMISGHGGAIGLLMDCVIDITGEAGFNEIFDSVVTSEDPVKLKILLAQIAIRRERTKYDPILDMKLKRLQSPRLKEVVDAHLKAATIEK